MKFLLKLCALTFVRCDSVFRSNQNTEATLPVADLGKFALVKPCFIWMSLLLTAPPNNSKFVFLTASYSDYESWRSSWIRVYSLQMGEPFLSPRLMASVEFLWKLLSSIDRDNMSWICALLNFCCGWHFLIWALYRFPSAPLPSGFIWYSMQAKNKTV